MKVLLTSILCHSGLMTHVHDLIQYCQKSSIEVSAAFLKSEYATAEQAALLKAELGEIEIWEYEKDDELLEIVEESKCDLIHAHSFLTFNAASNASRQLEVPLIITLHSVYLWGALYWEALAQANRIIAVGPAQSRFLGPWTRKTVVIPNGVDLDKFKPGTFQNGEEVNVLWYGRVDGRLSRGVVALDRMAPKLPRYVTIKAVGQVDVPLQNLEQQGWSSNPVEMLQESHITFAHGRSLREAMACGSIGMLIAHGYGGRISKERLAELNYAVDAFPQYHLPRPRPEDLLRDILDIIHSRDIASLRQEARRIAEEYFDLNLMGSRTVSVYEEVL